MDPSACRVIYIDDRFNTERWISRDGLSPVVTSRSPSVSNFEEMPADLQTNVNAFLSVFNQVYVCSSGRSFSTKLSELHDQVKTDCTPIIACFDVGSEAKHNHFARNRPRFASGADSPLPSPGLRREITFSSESDESYGVQLLSRIASDLQVEEGVQLIIPVAIVQPKRKDSYDQALLHTEQSTLARAPYGSETRPAKLQDHSDVVDPQMMLQCLDAGALDVVRGPLDKAAIMGLTVHAYRIYKAAKNEQKAFLAVSRKRRKQSWVGVQEEQPYSYLREAMVKKLLKGICDPQDLIEDYQHRDLIVQEARKSKIAAEVGNWGFCGHDFTEDELVYAGYCILNHALQLPALEKWRMGEAEILRFMQGCQVAYNSFVLYHNFRHAVDVLQSVFYFLVQIGILPPYPNQAEAPPHANNPSPIAKLLDPFHALTLLISAIGHDVGHPGVNNMFLVKLNAPLAQLYNDQSVLEAFHCAAYSQILRRHWPVVFHDEGMRKLMISSILATDMGVHSDFMQQLGNLQSKIHATGTTDGWPEKEKQANKTLVCGLLIKCADISNVVSYNLDSYFEPRLPLLTQARPWSVAEKWTHLLQREFAHQGEMEDAVGIGSTLFGGKPELGNMYKLAQGQIGFMTIFAHPLFANVADIIPAMEFAGAEILTNKAVWVLRLEKEREKKEKDDERSARNKLLAIKDEDRIGNGAVSPRSQSPVGADRERFSPTSPGGKRKLPIQTEVASNTDAVKIENENGISDKSHGQVSPPSITTAAIVSTGLGSSHTPSSDSHHLRTVSLAQPEVTEDADGSHAGNVGKGPMNVGSPEGQNGGEKVESALKDMQEDAVASMRAGSATVTTAVNGNIQPVEEEKISQMSNFTFATSNPSEPVREYDANKNYQPEHPEMRQSAPAIQYRNGGKEHTIDEKRQTTSAQSDTNTTSTSLRGGGQDGALTPTTSYMSDKSAQQASPTPQPTEFERSRARAASAPKLGHQFSNTSSLDSSSKIGIETTVFANGDISGEGMQRGRKHSTKTVGRRSSRIRLNKLAFWKKKDKSNQGEEAQEADGS